MLSHAIRPLAVMTAMAIVITTVLAQAADEATVLGSAQRQSAARAQPDRLTLVADRFREGGDVVDRFQLISHAATQRVSDGRTVWTRPDVRTHDRLGAPTISRAGAVAWDSTTDTGFVVVSKAIGAKSTVEVDMLSVTHREQEAFEIRSVRNAAPGMIALPLTVPLDDRDHAGGPIREIRLTLDGPLLRIDLLMEDPAIEPVAWEFNERTEAFSRISARRQKD